MEQLIFSGQDYDLRKTLRCGQTFRFTELAHSSGDFYVISMDRDCRVAQEGFGEPIKLTVSSKDDMVYWTYVLALNETEGELEEIMSGTQFLRDAYKCGRGIRIMHQDPWEMLISFIISQNNNIQRIKKIIDDLCWTAGTAFDVEAYAFPTPEQLLSVNLDNVGLGYRKSYVWAAAEIVGSGRLSLHSLMKGNCEGDRAVAELCRLPGVGMKVAQCVALFGLGHSNMFPVDTWIKRAIEEGNISQKDIDGFGEYAGLVQEHIYYYMLRKKLGES